MQMGSWISTLVRETLHGAEFANDDFMGRSRDIVSILELAEAMTYYATTVGYTPTWEVGAAAGAEAAVPASASSTFVDFKRRPGVYKAVCKKVDNWSTLKGGRKLALVKKTIRESVCDKAAMMRARPSPLGVFTGDAADMQFIYHDTDYKRVVRNLHRLGTYPQENPRFYTHMVYRYYMNEFHKQLADDDKVLRFPSMQKVMDIRSPVDCTGSTPPEFRMFLRNAKGNSVKAVTLPVPSKTKTNEVVYRHNFEATVPWVPVMRARIYDLFTELGARGLPNLFKQIYPKYLVRGEGGCETGNREVVDALARSIEFSNIEQTLRGLRKISLPTEELLSKVVAIDPRVGDIFPRYNRHPFFTEGEQLRERIGFLLQDSVRGVIRHIASKMSSFCNDVYSGLGMSYETMDVFKEYSTTKASMKYQKRDENEWRNFVIDMRKICCILHAWSMKPGVDRFLAKHGSAEGYLRGVLKGLE